MDDPRQRQDIEEFTRLRQYLLDYANQRGGLTDDECEGLAAMVNYGQHLKKRTVCPYEDLDDLAASVAFAKLTTSLD